MKTETPKELFDERGLFVENGVLKGVSYFSNIKWSGNKYGVLFIPEDVTSVVDEHISSDMNYGFVAIDGFYITDNCKSIDTHAFSDISAIEKFGVVDHKTGDVIFSVPIYIYFACSCFKNFCKDTSQYGRFLSEFFSFMVEKIGTHDEFYNSYSMSYIYDYLFQYKEYITQDQIDEFYHTASKKSGGKRIAKAVLEYTSDTVKAEVEAEEERKKKEKAAKRELDAGKVTISYNGSKVSVGAVVMDDGRYAIDVKPYKAIEDFVFIKGSGRSYSIINPCEEFDVSSHGYDMTFVPDEEINLESLWEDIYATFAASNGKKAREGSIIQSQDGNSFDYSRTVTVLVYNLLTALDTIYNRFLKESEFIAVCASILPEYHWCSSEPVYLNENGFFTEDFSYNGVDLTVNKNTDKIDYRIEYTSARAEEENDDYCFSDPVRFSIEGETIDIPLYIIDDELCFDREGEKKPEDYPDVLCGDEAEGYDIDTDIGQDIVLPAVRCNDDLNITFINNLSSFVDCLKDFPDEANLMLRYNAADFEEKIRILENLSDSEAEEFNRLLRSFNSEEDVRSTLLYCIEIINKFKSTDLKKEAAKAANEATRKKDGTLWKTRSVRVRHDGKGFLMFESTGDLEITVWPDC